jgi:peptidoglycan/LPS O-acetylase OafA/YrhL
LAPESLTPPTQANTGVYRPELDALRFFAFLVVFAHHTNPAKYRGSAGILLTMHAAGQFGVCLFFLLSAYLITDLLWREQARTGGIHLGAFYVRRILRIWPLYFLFLAGGVVGGMIWPKYAIEPGRLAAFLLLAGNWYCAMFGFTVNPIAPLWSISVEEQFYVLMPPLARAGGKRALLAISGCAILVAYGVLAWLGDRQASPGVAVWANSLVQFQFFGAGCILGTLLHGSTPKIPTAMRGLMAVGGLVLWLIAAHGGLAYLQPIPAMALCCNYLLTLLGTALLFLSFLGMELAIPAPIRYLGKISYGLYVYHQFVMLSVAQTEKYWDGTLAKMVRGVVELLITIAIASLSYEYFEKPFLRLKERFTFIPSRAS